MAADSVVEALDQQRLHVLEGQLHARVKSAVPLLLRGSSGLRGVAVGALWSLSGLPAGTRTGVSETDVFSFPLSAAWFGRWN